MTVFPFFGLPVLFYLALEWIFTPAIAIAMGYHARKSPWQSIVLGPPLIVIFTWLTPVFTTISVGVFPFIFNFFVPWFVEEAPRSTAMVKHIFYERIVWWACLYSFAFIIGAILRHLRDSKR